MIYKQNVAVVTARTWGVMVFGFLATALVYALIFLQVGGEDAALFWADVGETAIVGVMALVVIWSAFRFGRGEALRRNWLLIGMGVAMFAIGDLIWTYYEIFLGVEVPYPGLPDVFYLLEYPFVALGLTLAALAFRKLFDIRQPLAISALVVALLLAGAWVVLLGDMVLYTETALAERLLTAGYPIADMLLGFAPAFFMVLVVSRLGAGRIGWPWWWAAGGFLILAATDTAFAWLDWNEMYRSGHFIDAGWMLGHVFVGIAASLAVDVNTHRPTQGSRQP